MATGQRTPRKCPLRPSPAVGTVDMRTAFLSMSLLMLSRATAALQVRRWIGRGVVVGALGALRPVRPAFADAETPSRDATAPSKRGFFSGTRLNLFGLNFGEVELPKDGEADYYPALGPFAKEAADYALAGQAQPLVSEGAGKGKLHVGTFAGGCFWGLELAFQRVVGVEATSVGYTHGEQRRPTYRSICSGGTGHTEAVQVLYDPEQVSFDKLLEVFFSRTDPTTLNRQGADTGTQYRSGVYYHSEEQKAAAEKAFAEQEKKYGANSVVTELLEAKEYWPAEPYHQQYLEKGGRFGQPQSAEKGATDTIRCYG